MRTDFMLNVNRSADDIIIKGYVDDDSNVVITDPEMSGGGAQPMVLLASGEYVKNTETETTMSIPVEYSGTPKMILVYAPELISGVTQQGRWLKIYNLPEEIAGAGYPDPLYSNYIFAATGVPSVNATDTMSLDAENSVIICNQVNATYAVKNNTYKWFIWGYEE